jgi:hypothetical protein
MRYTAYNGYSTYEVWDCQACRALRRIQWVETDTARYGEYSDADMRDVITVQRKRIELVGRVFMVDPIEDEPEKEVADTNARHVPESEADRTPAFGMLSGPVER